jgi:hypothetical protein
MKIKTIDVNVKDWFDKINGNSYFAGTICLNYGTKTQKNINIPFCYGYGSHYETEAMNVLIKGKFIKDAEKYSSGGYIPLWRYCEDHKIIYRHSKKENCLKRELMYYNE